MSDITALANILITIAQSSFVIAMLPALLNSKTRIPWPTSLWYAVGLTFIAASFGLLRLWASEAATAAVATTWYLLLFFRSRGPL